MKRQMDAVREFNRYYTNILGLLDQRILNSPFSLSEIRILHEIEKTENCTAKILSEKLLLDPGYLSRILKSFQKSGFIERCRSQEDGRAQYLILPAEGQVQVNRLNEKSDEQIIKLLGCLSEEQKEELVYCMQRVQKILKAEGLIK